MREKSVRGVCERKECYEECVREKSVKRSV